MDFGLSFQKKNVEVVQIDSEIVILIVDSK